MFEKLIISYIYTMHRLCLNRLLKYFNNYYFLITKIFQMNAVMVNIYWMCPACQARASYSGSPSCSRTVINLLPLLGLCSASGTPSLLSGGCPSYLLFSFLCRHTLGKLSPSSIQMSLIFRTWLTSSFLTLPYYCHRVSDPHPHVF